MIEVTYQSLITTSAVIGALTGLIALFARLVRWADRQKAQDKELAEIRKKHDRDMFLFRAEESAHIREIKEEQTILTYGILACLKGLQEKGCNGPVSEAIGRMERHLNQKAHE